jgi:hypothetical protein
VAAAAVDAVGVVPVLEVVLGPAPLALETIARIAKRPM